MELESPGHRSPEGLFVLPAQVSFEVDPPGAIVSRFVAQGPEGDRELGFPTAGSDPGLDRPDRIPVQVERGRPAPLGPSGSRCRLRTPLGQVHLRRGSGRHG